MTQRIVKFTKMHGAGNDYIYVNTLIYNIPDPAAVSVRWSDRHKGIGSDGLVLIGAASSPEADYSMRIFNADGSEAMMCGNASRCIGKYLYEKGMTDKSVIRLETLSGIKTLKLYINDGKVERVTVDMLCPAFDVPAQYAPGCSDGSDGTLLADGRLFGGTFVSMGNPHFVTFVNDIATLDIARYGSILDGTLRTRVWERGSGITMACGTGACATAVAAALTGRSGRSSRIAMDGGTLDITWQEADNHVMMAGPAEFVFEGEINLDN